MERGETKTEKEKKWRCDGWEQRARLQWRVAVHKIHLNELLEIKKCPKKIKKIEREKMIYKCAGGGNLGDTFWHIYTNRNTKTNTNTANTTILFAGCGKLGDAFWQIKTQIQKQIQMQQIQPFYLQAVGSLAMHFDIYT